MRIQAVAVAALAALVMAAVAIAVPAPRVNGTVGPNPTISVTQKGKKVTKLKAGRYTFVIADKSNFHDFHLTGPGVNKSTTVAFVGTKTWTLTLKKGTYRFVCDPHKLNMKGSFTVS
jgi:plastocyanin